MPRQHRKHRFAGAPAVKNLLLILTVVTISPVPWFWRMLVQELSHLSHKPKFGRNKNASTTTTNKTEFFAPGSLNLTRLEAFQRCYADPERYREHFRGRFRPTGSHPLLDAHGRYRHRNKTMCSISQQYGVVYHQIEKSGSSTIRAVMKADYGARDYQECPETHSMAVVPRYNHSINNHTLHHFTAFREPMSRFVSSYSEVLRRFTKLPLDTNARAYVPVQYARFLRQRFWNVSTAEYFARLVRHQNNTEFLEAELAAMEQFVRDYDGADPFDTHLRLQVPRMMNPKTGRPTLPLLNQILDTAPRHLWDQLHALSRRWRHGNDTVSVQRVVYGRYAHERNALNVSRLSLAVRRKICQLSALDYCCLNYRLPPECAGLVQCRWVAAAAPTQEEATLQPAARWITAESPYPAVLHQVRAEQAGSAALSASGPPENVSAGIR